MAEEKVNFGSDCLIKIHAKFNLCLFLTQKNKAPEVKKGKKGAKIKIEKNAIGTDYDIFLKDNAGGGPGAEDSGDDFM